MLRCTGSAHVYVGAPAATGELDFVPHLIFIQWQQPRSGIDVAHAVMRQCDVRVGVVFNPLVEAVLHRAWRDWLVLHTLAWLINLPRACTADQLLSSELLK